MVLLKLIWFRDIKAILGEPVVFCVENKSFDKIARNASLCCYCKEIKRNVVAEEYPVIEV